MSAVLQQLDGMSVSEKMRVMEYLLKSIARAVESSSVQQVPQQEGALSFSERVHALRGIVRLPADFDEREFKAQRLAERFET